MARRVRAAQAPSRAGSISDLLPKTTDPGAFGVFARFVARLTPRSAKRRELAAVLLLLLAAGAISASLPGGWAASSPSTDPTAQLVADAATPTPYYSPDGSFWPAGTQWVKPTLGRPPVSPTPPPTPGPTKAPTAKPATRVYSFVAMGDSLTAWPSDSPWPERLDGMDGKLVMVNNAGVPGDESADMRARFAKDVVAYKPNVVFILAGTNDLGHRVNISTTIANIRAMIQAARAAKIVVFLMTVPPDSYTSQAPYIALLNKSIVSLANAYRIVVIDIHAPLTSSTGVYIPKYTSDGLHFSSLGAQTVANTVYARVRRVGY